MVETSPPGLMVLVDEVEAGRSPLGPLWLPAKTVRVGALHDDPRRFDSISDEAQVVIQPGGIAHVFLDLRPSVMVRSTPEPAKVFRVRDVGSDSLIGETPLWLAPSFLEGNRLRLVAMDHADSVFAGTSLLMSKSQSGTASVSLRRVAVTITPPPPRKPIYRKRWVQLGLVAVGAALTGGAALLRREGDRWYDRYQTSSDRRVLDEYFDRAVHYDHLSLASLASGQVLFTGGVVLLVSGGGR